MNSIITLNRSNLVSNGYDNTYEFQFRGSAANFTNSEVAINSISMYNNVFNIDSTYGNNTIAIKMPTAATTSTVTISILDGLYSYENLSKYIQKQLKEAGAYLINSDGLEVHYIQLSSNEVYYACQIDCSPVPASLPSGWTRPATGLYSATGTGLPTTTRVPILSVGTAEFGSIIGFTVADYPSTAQTTLQTFLSNQTPQIHPVSSYLVRCNLINNPYTMPSDIMGSFDKQGAKAGEQISYKPNEHLFLPIADGSYSNVRITIVDQDERFVKIRDRDINIMLIIKSKK